jgi:ankyrin repeat protein
MPEFHLKKVLYIVEFLPYTAVMINFAAALGLSLLLSACDPGVPIPPIAAAARSGDTARIAKLANAGADVNERGGVNHWTPLMHAVHKNQAGAVIALIEAGADLNATAGRDTALRLAELQNEPAIAKILKDHGAQ